MSIIPDYMSQDEQVYLDSIISGVEEADTSDVGQDGIS